MGSTVVATAGDDSVGTWRAMEMMVGLMKGKDGIDWLSKLPSVLEEEGFEETVVQLVRPEMALLKSYSACHLLVWPEIASSLAKGSSQRVQLEKMLDELADETRKGACFGVGKSVVVAKKPGLH